MEKENLHVLVVEDDEDDFFIARSLLTKARSIQCTLDWSQSYEEGLEAITTHPYDVALVDYRLGAHNGLDLLREAAERGSQTPVILLTGQNDLNVDLNAMVAGAADYLVKGQIDAQLLERSIRYARERKRAEERIREQAALLDKARDAISACDLDGRIVYWNRSAERLTGWTGEEMLGQRSEPRLFGADDERLQEAWDAVKREGEWGGELTLHTRSGEEVIVESRWTLVQDAAGQPTSVLIINTDVTERKKLEAQFLRAQRMDSIGRLVGGIAHDLGNLLVPILLGVKVLQQRFADDEKTSRTLAMIQKSAQRGSDMVKQVLAFARGVEGERVPVELDQVVREVEKITREAFPANIQTTLTVPDDLWMVKGDATQLQQVLMNLCVNARDAMPEGGDLHIQTENLVLDEAFVERNIDSQPGTYVRVTVTDTGTGIPPEVVNKVFEPFFTTKEIGKGTGLGLSTVYSIVKSHGGFLGVYSEAGEGTSFHIYLPALQEKVRQQADDQDTVIEGAGELVLVAEDEEYVRQSTVEILEYLGYRVLAAADGREAIQVFDQHGSEIDLLLTDLMMPNVDGLETIRAIRSLRPDLPIVAASGMTGAKAQQALDAGAQVCLSKPFTTEKLSATLHGLLHPDGAKAAQGTPVSVTNAEHGK